MQGISTKVLPLGLGTAIPPDIPEDITILARDLHLLNTEHLMLSKQECQQLSVLQVILNSQALLQCQIAHEAKHIEAETWNLDTVLQLASLTKKLGQIPFQHSSQSLGKQRATVERLAESGD
jgi:hypothetical protein